MKPPFHPLVQRWFAERFQGPTPAQAQGWVSIAAGKSTLIAAPTGSGKTLAAFLWSIDRLIKRALEGGLDEQGKLFPCEQLPRAKAPRYSDVCQMVKLIVDSTDGIVVRTE